jgi:5,6,7,8-tetrahydromethanopterin hydro-lyase
MAKINRVMVGEALVGEGNEVAHIDLLLGPRGSAAETAFCGCSKSGMQTVHCDV